MKRSFAWIGALGLAVLVLQPSLALGTSGPAPTGRIVFGMNHFCTAKGQDGPEPVDCGKGEIAVIDASGSDLRVGTGQHYLTRLRTAPSLYAFDDEPALSWSPDGRQIVFSAFPSKQGGREQLYLLDAHTHALKRLPTLAAGATDPVWSPNGRWIAFTAALAPGPLFVMSARTHQVHQLRSHGGGGVTGQGLVWSPDSSRLAFNALGKLTVFDLETGLSHVVARYGGEPSWSPDGQWIVFTYGGYVKEVRADGQGIRHILYIAPTKGENFGPDWGR